MVSSKYRASGPVALMYESAKILNIHNGVIQDITCGSYMSKTEWKHLVKRHINMREKHVLQASCLLYSRLNVYHKSVNDIRMWPWWTYSLDNPRHTHKCRTLLMDIMTRARTILTMMIRVILIVILMCMALLNWMIMSCNMIFMGRMTVGCIL